MKTLEFILAAALASTAFSAQADGMLTSFDVAEDISRFVFAEAPVFDDGMPAYGNPFITQGYVYPAGTLDGGVEGTLADGSAAFPDKVIGIGVDTTGSTPLPVDREGMPLALKKQFRKELAAHAWLAHKSIPFGCLGIPFRWRSFLVCLTRSLFCAMIQAQAPNPMWTARSWQSEKSAHWLVCIEGLIA